MENSHNKTHLVLKCIRWKFACFNFFSDKPFYTEKESRYYIQL